MNGHPPLRYLTDLDDDGKSGLRPGSFTITERTPATPTARPSLRPAMIAIAIIVTFAAGALIGHSIGIQHGKTVAAQVAR